MSIGTQDDFLEQYCGLYGLEVVGAYRDEGVSGTVPLHERPGGGRLLDDALSGKLEVVLVYKLDRIGRTLLNVVDAHDRLSTADVALRSATEPIDTSAPSGRLIFHMLALSRSSSAAPSGRGPPTASTAPTATVSRAGSSPTATMLTEMADSA